MLSREIDLNNLHSLNIASLKRTYNVLSKSSILEENDYIDEDIKQTLLSYKNQKDLWALYRLSQNKYSSFKEMILGD